MRIFKILTYLIVFSALTVCRPVLFSPHAPAGFISGALAGALAAEAPSGDPASVFLNPGEYQGIAGLLKFIDLVMYSGIDRDSDVKGQPGLPTPAASAGRVDATMVPNKRIPGGVKAVVLPATGCDSTWAGAIDAAAVSTLESMGILPIHGSRVKRAMKEAGLTSGRACGLDEFEEIEEAIDCDLIISLEVSNPSKNEAADLRGFLRNPGSMGKSTRIKAQISAQVFLPSRGTGYRLKPVAVDSRTRDSGPAGLNRVLKREIEKLLGGGKTRKQAGVQ